jgi:hypothetical protein
MVCERLEESQERNLQCRGNGEKSFDRDIASTKLNLPNIGPAEADGRSERVLRKPSLLPVIADGRTEQL